MRTKIGKTVVAIHGCHVNAKHWDVIAKGRVRKGVDLAIKHRAEIISFSTGASERDGRSEAQLMYECAQSVVSQTWAGHWILRPFQERAVLDEVSKNTSEELLQLSKLCVEQNVSELYLVSSPWHVPRCLKEALVLKTRGHFSDVDIYAVGSEEKLDDLLVSDVVIIEPPHRGDDPMLGIKPALHEVIPKLFRLSPEDRTDILRMVNNNIPQVS